MNFDILDDQIRDIILVNGGDIDITDCPHIIIQAEEQKLHGRNLPKK